jgi:hypothetical protein
MQPKKRLGEMLIDAGVIGEPQLKAALGHQRQWGVRIGQALVDLKLASEAEIVRALSVKFGFEVAQLDRLDPHGLAQALKLLPREFALRHNVFPMGVDSGSVTVAMSDPTNLAVVDEVRFRSGRRVRVYIGGDRAVAEAVRRHYPAEGEVEAIALDLDVDGDGDAVHDPFGGGPTDDLAAFFSEPARPAPEQPAPRAPAPSAPPPPQGSPPAPALAALEDEITGGEPILATDLVPDDEEGGRPLTPEEVAILASLDRLASGAHAEPEIVKPAQAMAALVRLLLRKRIIGEEELLDELARK